MEETPVEPDSVREVEVLLNQQTVDLSVLDLSGPNMSSQAVKDQLQ